MILAKLLEAFCQINDDQFGFRAGSSTSNAIFVLISLRKKQLLKGQYTYLAFVDFSSAFESVNYQILYGKLAARDFSAKFLHFIMKSYCVASHRIKWAGKISKASKLERGVRQGKPTSGFQGLH